MTRNSALFIVCVFVGLCGGCRQDADTPKYKILDGRVTNINTTTGEVEMNYYNPKQKKDQTISGKLAPEAEIWIDGATARLEDVRVDDKVKVTGREEKRNDKRQMVAVKVEVIRAESGATTTKPAANKP